MPTEEMFKPGDHVRVKDHAGSCMWTVDAIDTNLCGGWGIDQEPAYKLRRPDKAHSRTVRYAYQSDLVQVP